MIEQVYKGGAGAISYYIKYNQIPFIITGLTSSSNQAIPYFVFGYNVTANSIYFGQSGQERNYFIAIGF